MSRRILVVDDDVALREMLSLSLAKEGYRVQSAGSVPQATALLEKNRFDLLLSDIYLGEQTALSMLEWVRERHARMKVILITAHGTIESAAQAHAHGVFDYVAKPFNLDVLLARIETALATGVAAAARIEPSDALESMIIGNDPTIVEVYKAIARAAALPVPVLILGESGTGKELVARALHRFSRRGQKPFVALNCGALASGLLASELFGHRRGAFTNAYSDRRGAIDEARGGTLFLDEIGETSPSFQVDFLRFLEEGEYRPVGADRTSQADVRVVAASNRNLEQAIRLGEFREDLFYRLAVYVITLPPLRNRAGDIPILVEHFRKKFQAEFELGEVGGPTAAVLRRLAAYSWPGNVRELENVVQRAIIDNGSLADLDAMERYLCDAAPREAAVLQVGDMVPLREIQKKHLELVLAACGGNRSRAAQVLGIERRSLYRMALRFGVPLDPQTGPEEDK